MFFLNFIFKILWVVSNNVSNIMKAQFKNKNTLQISQGSPTFCTMDLSVDVVL